jgi:hypothetical protein
MTDTTVKLKRSSTSGGVPNISDLSLGELAVNTFDGKLFFKKDNGTASIIEVGSGSGGGSGPSAAVKVLLYEKTNSGNADSFDGSETQFQLRDDSGTVISNLSSASQLLISIDGVVQEPNSSSSGTDGFYISNTASGTDIIFLAAPASGSDFFGMVGILSGSFATVATSGDYDDLTNKPTLSPVMSVAGKTGTVALIQSDIGSGAVTATTGTYANGATFGDSVGIGGSPTGAFGAIDKGLLITGTNTSVGLRVHTSHGNSGILEMYAESGGCVFDTRGSDYIRFASAGTEFMRIDSSGSVSVGSTATSGTGVHLRPFGNVISRRASGSLQVFEGYQGSTLTSEILANGNARFGGKVGIGCTPVRDLQLHTSDASSELMLSNSTTGATAGSGFMIQQDGNDNYIWNKENSFMSFGTNALERMRIDSTGDLKLQYTGKFILTEGTNSAFSISTNGANGHFLIRDEYNSSDRMIINNSGRVGIGTSNPSHALHVTGDIRAGTTSYNDYGIKAYTNSASYGGIYAQNNNPSGFVFTGNNGSANTILIKADGKVETTGSGSFYTVNRTGTLSPTAALYLGFADGSQKFKVGTDGTGTFAGKLGVGTTTPAKDLEIFNDSFPCLMLNDGNQYKSYMQLGGNDLEIRGSSGKLEFYTGAADGLSSDERMCITNAGKVGIGNADPGALLQVANSSNHGVVRVGGNNDGATGLDINYSNGGTTSTTIKQNYRATNGNALLNIDTGIFTVSTGTSGDEHMRIDGTGRLLVGTTSPTTSSVTTRISAYSDTNDWMLMDIGATQSGNTGGVYGVRSRSASNNPIAVASAFESATEVVCYYGGGWGGYGRSANNLRFYTSAAVDNASGTSGNERMRIRPDGSVLIGTTTASSHGNRLLQIGKTDRSETYLELRTATTGVSGLLFSRGTGGGTSGYKGTIEYNQSSDYMLFKTEHTERMRIDSNGTLRTLMTGGSGRLHLATDQGAGSTILLNVVNSRTVINSGGSASCRIYSDGDIENSNNSYEVLSDENLKENIVDANSQWDDIKSLRIRKFNFKEETGNSMHTQIGVVAQEVELVSPGLVKVRPALTEEGEEAGDTVKTVSSSVLYMKAVKALQEAMERIETLEQRLSDASIA